MKLVLFLIDGVQELPYSICRHPKHHLRLKLIRKMCTSYLCQAPISVCIGFLVYFFIVYDETKLSHYDNLCSYSIIYIWMFSQAYVWAIWTLSGLISLPIVLVQHKSTHLSPAQRTEIVSIDAQISKKRCHMYSHIGTNCTMSWVDQ